jgi:similar to spore coat protein
VNGRLAMHETLDLHELVGLKDVCARKASAMQMMVQDPQLRHFLQQDIQSSTRHAQEIQQLLSSTMGGRQ